MAHACRFCTSPLEHSFVDLGVSPLANRILSPAQLQEVEPFYPLHAYVCATCFLVQLPAAETPDRLFGDYAYFSSYSESWLRHARAYAETMVEQFHLGASSLVVEVASNDGYLLQYFQERGVPVLGVEPARNVAQVAQDAGIPTLVKFFGIETATELVVQGRRADLLIGNNVLAHVPDLGDFVGGLKRALSPRGILTLEFPHLLRLMTETQFDTIYHEHFSYFSFMTVERIFAHHGLTLFDVDELPTHGGSLRIFGRHVEDSSRPTTHRVEALRLKELQAGLDTLQAYTAFGEQVRRTKRQLLGFLNQAKDEGKSIAAYGAPAKGNTLLNYCGIGTDYLDYTVDRNPHKQGRYLPGTRIPIRPIEAIRQTKPDYLLILPWNLKDEIMGQLGYIREWGGRFVTASPETRILP